MSGNTIGGIAGGLIGFAITGTPMGAQWGWMIGSVVGGIVDPQTIQGAQWQNQQLQGSADGLGRAVIFGTATVTGNLLDAEPGGPRIGKKSESGKGGPEVERDTAILTYAIEICDSSELRGTKVSGVIAVWEDEKLVYDVRPDSDGLIDGGKIASSQKWLANKTFYFGGEDQMPPPELEAIHGSGNVPAYRGSCIMVVHDEDLMVDVDDKPRGRIPTYRFLVSACEPVLPETPAYIVGGSTTPGIARARVRPLSSRVNWIGETYSAVMSPDDSSVVLRAIRFNGRVYAFVYSYSTAKWVCRTASISQLDVWEAGPDMPDGSYWIKSVSASANNLWIACDGYGLLRLTPGAPAFVRMNSLLISSDRVIAVADAGDQVLVCDPYANVWASGVGSDSFSLVSANFGPFRFYSYGIEYGGAGVVLLVGKDDYGVKAMRSGNFGQTFDACEIGGTIADKVASQVKWCGGKRWVMACEAPAGQNGFYASLDDGASFYEVATSEALYSGIDRESAIAIDSRSRRTVIFGWNASNQKRRYYSDNLELWVPFAESDPEILTAGVWDLNPLSGDSTPIPDSPGYYVDGDGNVIGPDMPIASLCGAPLDQVVRKLHKLGAPQLSDAEFDLEPLEGDIVRGYAIQDAAVTVAEACDPLRRVWTFDLPSYDGQIHAIKRGRDADWVLPEDDLIAMDSDYEQSMQDDTVSLPRKLHLAYSDLNIDYKETTQISERYSTDVRVVGEEKISMGQLVLSATEAKQAVVKQHKLAWLNAEDTRTLSAPLEYIGAVNSDIVQFRGRRYRIDQMRVDGLQVTFESAAYDRASSYQSTAVGTEGVPPPPMGGALRGPTVSVFMNLPVLRDADDKAGIYWAASGLLEGWRGALLQMSRDGTTFENLNIAVPTPCTIGTLQAGILSASRYGMDEVNQIMVKLNPLSPGLDSTDMDGLLREANSAAILYADGTAEIVQFQNAVETAPREYTLSGLLRGRLDTTPGAHNAGARFVLLNDAIRFVPLRNDDVGATLTFRAMSAGTVAENNDSVALTLGSFKSLAEWEPAMVRATTGTNEVSVTWAGRGRLGSSRMPVHSLNFKEYRVTVTKGGASYTVFTTAQAATVPAPGIAEPYTTTVAAISRIASQFDSSEGA